jgi:heat shock protein HslJ
MERTVSMSTWPHSRKATTTTALTAAAVLAVLMGAGCSDDLVVPSAGGAPTAAELDGTTWLSTEVTGETLADGTRITLSFSESSLAIVGGCNTQLGGFSIDGDRLVVEALAQTLMACEDGLAAQDAWIAELIESGPSVSRDGDSLTIAGTETTISFVDRAASSGGVLDGSTWLLDELETSTETLSAPDGSHVAFDGSSVYVATGCNNGVGSVEAGEGSVTIGAIALTLRACEPDLQAWEQALGAFLAGSLEYTIDGDSVTFTNGDQTLRGHFIP